MGFLTEFFLDYVHRKFYQREATGTSGVSAVEASAPRRGFSYDDLIFVGNPALSIATVYRCVKLLSDSVAQLTCQYMRQRDGIFVPDAASRLNYLLNVAPNPSVNAYDFKSQIVTDVLMKGNAYIVPEYLATDMGVELTRLVLTDKVQHDCENDLFVIEDPEQGISGTYAENQVIHIKGMTHTNPKSGLSVLSYARLVLDTASAGDKETCKRFATGGIVRGIVSNDKSVRGFGEYADKELNKTADNLEERFNVNGENIVALSGAVTWNGMAMTSADMQFLETRKFTVREICRFFGVHPSFVFDDTSNNYKSAEMANLAFLSNTLNPILRKIEVEFLRKLVPESLAGKRRFIFDREELNTCDLDGRIRYQTGTIASGIYTINEWRRKENKPLLDGGDTLLVSANLQSVKDLGKPKGEQQPQPKKDNEDE